MTSRPPYSGVTLVSHLSRGTCFEQELQKPCWRVAVRRCLEFSRAQRWRAEPLLGSQATRLSFAQQFRAIVISVWLRLRFKLSPTGHALRSVRLLLSAFSCDQFLGA